MKGGNMEEVVFIEAIVGDCEGVRLSKSLKQNHVGQLFYQPDPNSDGELVTVDLRSRIAHLTRNILIEGGDHPLWDKISGISGWNTGMGGTIVARPGYKEKKLGWDETMTGFEKYGNWHFPMGKINVLKWARFKMMGKQGGMILDRSFWSYPHVVRGERSGVAWGHY